MGREAKPYLKNNHYCTSYGGRKHQKLVHKEKGFKAAKIALQRLILRDAEEQKRLSNPQAFYDPLAFSADDPVGDAPYCPLIATAVDEFLDHKKVNSSPGDYDWAAEKLEEFREFFGNRPTNSFSHVDANDYKRYLTTERVNKRTGKKAGLANSTINHHLSVCKQLFRWMTRPENQGRYKLVFDPFKNVKKMLDKPRERLVTPEEFEILHNNCKSGNCVHSKVDMQDILAFMRYTPSRPSEMRKVRWEHIDWTKGNERVVIPAELVKTRKRREMTILPPLLEVLLKRRARFDEMGKGPRGLIFPKPGFINGVRTAAGSEEEYDKSAWAYKFRRLKDRCVKKGLIEAEVNGESLVPYSSRHARITEMFEQEIDSAAVQFEAGHTNPVTTERYKHLQGSRVAQKIRQGWSKANERGDSSGSEDSPESPPEEHVAK